MILGEEWSDDISFMEVVREYIVENGVFKLYEQKKVLELGVGGGRVAR